ncbi:MAG: exodeoxyribonuclease VII large subunit [Gammaproteobacteria bacterium]|nr:MAG: exodeoxyribonuclease VII large subunit [Gammaproteobacteria bacterium]TLZ45427.1 MAG: exodeoxyribonuclease VII large subunit [Gammaproteobacteria bacterium]
MAPSPDRIAGAPPAREVYSVTRVNREVRALLERGLPVLWVEGELTNFSQPASGHWYFTLKDREAQLRCAMFRMRNALVGFTPSAGAQVLVRGRVSVYEARGEYQLIVEHLEDAGVGALRREFERLKAKLAAEGLFALERKRGLPRFPRRIGVITSPSGAALRDILHILARRFPPAPVLIYPTAVQGAAAAPALVAALEIASGRAEVDVLILARGGGSLEDLWAYNDERVARAIYASRLPIVSGVGHEIDFTIADFVADARAPTPSAAAELVAPDGAACLQFLARSAERLAAAMRRELRASGARFEATERRLKLAHPGVRLQQQMQRLDDLAQRLAALVHAAVGRDRLRLAQSLERLVRRSPEHLAREHRLRHQGVHSRLLHAMRECVARAAHRLALAQRALNAVSPLATLTRGFAIVTRGADGSLLTNAATVAVGEEIEARLAHGRLNARVTGRSGES